MKTIDKKIFVIIPAYNEQRFIGEVVTSILREGFHHIVVVDDGSTEPLVSSLSNLPVTCLRHAVNLGQGAALQTGFNYAKLRGAEVVVTFDADGQHDPKDISQIITPILLDEADVVLGSRFLKSNQHIPLLKRIVLQIARFVNFTFSGLMLSDAHNGLRAFNQTALKKIHLTENRMAHASEILFEIKKAKLRYQEFPVHISYSQYSRMKGQNPWDSIKILFDLILHKLFK